MVNRPAGRSWGQAESHDKATVRMPSPPGIAREKAIRIGARSYLSPRPSPFEPSPECRAPKRQNRHGHEMDRQIGEPDQYQEKGAMEPHSKPSLGVLKRSTC